MRNQTFAIGLFFLLVSIGDIHAQGPLVVVGSKIRFRTSVESEPTIGSVLEMEDKSILVADRNRKVSRVYLLSDLRSVEVSTRETKLWPAYLGGGVGLATGVVIGGAWGMASAYDSEPVNETITGAIIGGVAGCLLGVGIGLLTGKERWQYVPPSTLSTAKSHN